MVRSSLGRAALLDSGLTSEEYPFCAISVPDFLGLTEWQPHQDLKASGEVREMSEGDDVIFCSHQWTSFSHPDPAGNQLRALQTQIRTLMKGKTAVRSDAVLDGGYGYSMLTAGKARGPRQKLRYAIDATRDTVLTRRYLHRSGPRSCRPCTSGSITCPFRSRAPPAPRTRRSIPTIGRGKGTSWPSSRRRSIASPRTSRGRR